MRGEPTQAGHLDRVGAIPTRHLVLGLAALLFLWNLGGHDLWAPDEPYFGEGAREMVVDGQWAVPHVNGVVTTDKPPLFFWTIALFSLPAGRVTPWTARLPSALAGLCVLLLVMRLGRRHANERVAWLATLTLATAATFWEKARWVQIEMLLCLLIWSALSAFDGWRSDEADGRRAGLLFWLAAALAVLAKGPVGFLLPLGVALVTLAADRKLGRWRRFAPWSGPLLFAVVIGAWMVLATVGGAGEYSVWAALKKHFIDRGIYGLHHRQPPWYYLEVLPADLMPWTGLLPGALLLAWRRRRASDRFLLAASLFVVAFFTISTEKRNLYLLPAFPAFALLVARFVDHLARRSDGSSPPLVDRRWLFGSQIAVGGLLSLVGAGLPVAMWNRQEVPYWMVVVLGALFLATGLGTLWACRGRRVLAAALVPAVGLAVTYLFAAHSVYPIFDLYKSARPFALRLKAATAETRAAGGKVLAYDLSNLPEAFSFYGDGLYTVETKDPQALAEHLRRPGAWAVVNGPVLDQLPADLRPRLTIVDRADLSQRQVLLVTNGGQPAGEPVARLNPP